MKTYIAKKEDIKRKWYIIDADNYTLGRLSTKVADVLRGKTKAIYTPHVDTGDFVIVINAASVKLTGRKEEKKLYRTYSGYQGGLKVTKASEIRKKKPEYMIKQAVRNMIPKNKLGRAVFKKLKVYAGSEHKHEAQKPELLQI